MSELERFVVFRDQTLARRARQEKLPMSTLFEAYLDEALDIPDLDRFLDRAASS